MSKLFSPKHPVNPNYFVNRTDIIQAFIKAVKSSSKSKPPLPDNLAILGNWGMGKSSVLVKFEQIVHQEIEGVKAFTAFIELLPAACQDFYHFSLMLNLTKWTLDSDPSGPTSPLSKIHLSKV